MHNLPAAELRVPSLGEGRLHGHAHRYLIVLPLLSHSGEPVLSLQNHLDPLQVLLAERFGGYTMTTPAPQPPYQGGWMPQGKVRLETDWNLILQVYSRPIPEADQFFGYLKSILRKMLRQEEVLIERTAVWLIPAIDPP
jgi:hypothetical protein